MRFRAQFVCSILAVFLAFLFATEVSAADDAQRLAGEWKITVPINGVPTAFDMTYSGSKVQVYVIVPTGKILVRAGDFTAADGHYAEANTKPGEAQSADYTFPNDNTVRMTNAFGVFEWHRAVPTTHVAAGAQAKPEAPAPAKPDNAPQVAIAPAPSPVRAERLNAPSHTPRDKSSNDQPSPDATAAPPVPAGDGVTSVTVPVGTVLYAQYSRKIMASDVNPDKLLPALISQPIVVDGKTAIPADAVLYFKVHEAPPEQGQKVYAFTADHLRMRGVKIPIKAESKTIPPAGFVLQEGQGIMEPVTEAFNVPLQDAAVPDTSDDEKAPWSSPDELADCALIDGQLVNVASNTVLADHWTFRPRAVVGRPDLVYNDDAHSLLQIAFPQKQLAAPPTAPGIWLNADLRRVVMIQDGDIWRGEFDWLHNTVINKKQLTRSGLFEGCALLLWHDNIMYLTTPLSREKPVIRIDLLSGELKQLPPDGITAGAHTPDGRLILSPIAGHIMLYNTVTGQTGTMPSTVAVPGHAGQTDQLEIFGALAVPTDRRDPDALDPWIEDESAIALFSTGPQNTAVLGLAHFSRGKSRVVALLQGQAEIKQILPGKQFVDITVTRGSQDTPYQTQRILVSLADGKQTVLPIPGDNGFWVDDHRFVYGIAKGDLDKLGVYVYSRTDGKTTQIAQRPAELHLTQTNTSGGATIYLPHCDTIIFHAATAGRPLCAVKLDGSGLKQLAGGEADAIHADPVDLGLGESPKPLWQPVNYSQADNAVPTAAANDPNQPGDELTVKAATKDLPEDEQKRAMYYYGGAIKNASVKAYYDPAKVALKCLAVSRTAPNKEFDAIILKLDLRDCVFKPSVERYATNMVYDIVKMRVDITEQQKTQIVKDAAKEFTRRFMAGDYQTEIGPDALLQQCYSAAEDKLKH